MRKWQVVLCMYVCICQWCLEEVSFIQLSFSCAFRASYSCYVCVWELLRFGTVIIEVNEQFECNRLTLMCAFHRMITVTIRIHRIFSLVLYAFASLFNAVFFLSYWAFQAFLCITQELSLLILFALLDF